MCFCTLPNSDVRKVFLKTLQIPHWQWSFRGNQVWYSFFSESVPDCEVNVFGYLLLKQPNKHLTNNVHKSLFFLVLLLLRARSLASCGNSSRCITPAFSGRRCRGCVPCDQLCRWGAAERQGVLCRAVCPGPRSCRLKASQDVPLQRFVRFFLSILQLFPTSILLQLSCRYLVFCQ